MLRLLLALVTALALTIGAAAQPAAAQKKAESKAAGKAEAKKAEAKKTGEAALVDLNTATIEQLKSLPGIGDAYAKKIVEGRPYKMKNQLVTKNVLSQSQYDKIKDAIVAKQ